MRKRKRARRYHLWGCLAFVILLLQPYLAVESEGGAEIKQVALTYDDGPDPRYTEQILDVLAEEDIHATFFLMGKQVEQYPEIVKKMGNEGHLLGNHTYSHININRTPEIRVREEIGRTNQLICSSSGITPEFFRPPFGCNQEKLFKQMGLIPVFWTLDTLDWQSQNAPAVVNHILKHVKDDDIILMHDEFASTVEATRILIPKLKEMGYTFVTVDEILLP